MENTTPVRACYPHLLKEVANNGGHFTWDTAMAKSFRIQHTSTMHKRFMGPIHLGVILGMPRRLMDSLNAALPCEGEIDYKMGQTREWRKRPGRGFVPEEAFNPCGTRVLCGNCGKVARALGNSWSYPVAVEVVQHVLTAVGKGTPSRGFLKGHQIHKCGQNCPYKMTRKQYDGK